MSAVHSCQKCGVSKAWSDAQSAKKGTSPAPQPAPAPAYDSEATVPASQSSPTSILLLLRSGPMSGTKFRCREGNPVYIGRDSSRCNLTLSSYNTVSGLHCRIDVSSSGITATDLGSTNGTYVDTVRLMPNQPVSVTNSAKLMLGNAECIFQVQFEQSSETENTEDSSPTPHCAEEEKRVADDHNPPPKRVSPIRILLTILAIVLAVILLVGYTFFNEGYRGLPIASNCDEFKAFVDKTFPKHELTKSNATERHYQLIPNDSTPGSYLSIINAASPSINFEIGGTVTLPVDSSKLMRQGWTYVENISSFGTDYFINDNNEVIQLQNDGLYSMLRVYTNPTHHRRTDTFNYEHVEYEAPSFTICNGITKNANIQQIIKKVGSYPSILNFYENGSGDLSGTPTIYMCYYIFRNGIFQNAFVEFTLNAELNAIHSVSIVKINK